MTLREAYGSGFANFLQTRRERDALSNAMLDSWAVTVGDLCRCADCLESAWDYIRRDRGVKRRTMPQVCRESGGGPP